VTVGANGRATVAWLEKPKDGNWGVYRMLKSATVESGASKATAIQDLSHTAVVPASRAALAVMSNGTVAAAYTAPDMHDDVYVRELVGGSGNWTRAVNVSRDGGKGSHLEPSIQATPSGLVVTWLTVVKAVFKVSKAETANGFWLRPQTLAAAPPGQRIFFPKSYQEPNGTLHLVWTGTSNGVSVDQEHYRIIPPPPPALPPAPTVEKLSPAEGGWTNLRKVPLSAFILSDSPIDMGRTTLAVDGSPVPISLSAGGTLSGEAAVGEGRHEALLAIRDKAGNTVTKEWAFGVDLTAPRFSAAVVDQAGKNVTGWTRSLLHLDGQAQQDGGAPVRLQVSFGDDGNWKDITAAEATKMGLRLEPSGLTLPSGYLLHVRARALDEAGNVVVGRTMSVGWDDRTQNVEAAAPTWSTSALSVSLHAASATSISAVVGPGPPIHATATASPKGRAGAVQSVTAVFLPQENGTLSFTGLAAGSYTVAVEGSDEAGNAVTFAPATLDVEVDTEAPSVAYAAGVLSVHDAGSGVASVRLTSGPTVVQEADGGSAGSSDTTVQWPPGTSVLSLHIRDRAGNTLERILDREAGILRVQAADGSAIASSPHGIPALPGFAVAVLLVALAGLRRR
jgi:hypothetical protein